jgi:hypothetical protein
MTLYTMSGKRTTIEERDSTSEEERMAEVRARLFTLFDDDAEKEREYAEQNGLKNRATGTFQKIRSIIDDSEEAYDDKAGARDPAAAATENRASESRDAERRKPVIPEQRRRRDENTEQRRRRDENTEQKRRRDENTEQKRRRDENAERERPSKKRIEQERRVRPVNPVRAMDTGGFERPEARRREADRAEAPPRKERPSDMPDESFRLGDLFKDKEPDIFNRWEQDDETERRIRERRERRRAEAARRGRGEDDASKMKTAAALFIAREGMKNFFGKLSGPAFRDQDQEEEEREAEEALRELAKARDYDRDEMDALPPRSSEATARAEAIDDDRHRAQKTGRNADRDMKDSALSAKTKSQGEAGKRKRPAQAAKEDEPRRERRARDFDEQVVPKRSKKREAEAAKAETPATDGNTAAIEMKADRFAAGGVSDMADMTDDEASYEPSLLDYVSGGARPSGGAIAWMAGGAAGAVAVVVIAMMIVNSHVAELLLG